MGARVGLGLAERLNPGIRCDYCEPLHHKVDVPVAAADESIWPAPSAVTPAAVLSFARV